MSRLIYPDYEQRYILPPSMDSWIPMDSSARFLREAVDALDLKKLGFKFPDSNVGRPMYAPSMLLKIVLYCYMERITSLRRMERECYKDINLIWLTGDHRPDHSTISRFWANNKSAIRDFYTLTVDLAVEMELVGLVLQAVDGTKMRAACSVKGALSKKVLKKRAKGLDKRIAQIEAEIEKAEGEESHDCRLPEKLQDKKALREKVKKGLAKLEEAGMNNLQPSEPEARVMKATAGLRYCYNAQVVADDKAGIIVAADVLNEENDLNALVPMLDKVRENLGKVAETTLADRGYDSGKQLELAEGRKYNVLVNERKEPKKEDGAFGKSNFAYDKERDVFICPLGKELTREQARYRKDRNIRVIKYRCRSFQNCPMRDACSRDKRGRSVEGYEYSMARLKNSKRLEDPANVEKLKMRMAIVEPVFARIKWIGGFTRWTVKGLENVQAQWSMLCAVHNLKRILANWPVKEPEKA